MQSKAHPRILALFDVDGTLTPARKVIEPAMMELLEKLRKEITIGFVGGSDLNKQQEQLNQKALELFDYSFSENGLMAFKCSEPIYSASFIDYIGEEKYQNLVNFILHYIADLKIPKKRGTFVEFRRGMINVSPIGRNCSYDERLEFEQYDKEHGIRKSLVSALESNFPEYPLKYSIGGQISIDIFPIGWDKTYCLKHIDSSLFDEIHFFGDKTMEGGNDYEIYNHPRVTGHKVSSPSDTMKLVKNLFLKN